MPHQIAFLYAFIAQTSFVVAQSLVQVLTKSLTPIQVLYFAGLVVAIINYFIMKRQGESTYSKIPKITKMLLFRGFFGFACAVFLNTGISLMPLSESIVIQQTSPVFTGLLAFCLLSEKYNRTLVLTTIFSFVGIILISKPAAIFGANSEKEAAVFPYRSLGIVLTLIGSFANSVIQITLKKIGGASSPNSTAFYWGIGLTMSSPIVQTFKGAKPFYFGLTVLLVLVGLCRFINQIYLHKSFALGEANKVSLISYSQVPIAYIVDVFIFGVTVDIYSAIGSVCVFSCVFLMIYKNHTETKMKNAKMAKATSH